MTEKQALYFERAYAAGNIAAASAELFVSRSVVSRAILELEREFGLALFERSKNGITPTDAGTMLHMMIVEIAGSLNMLTERFRRLNDAESGRLVRVGATPTNIRVICRLLFGEFHEEYPSVKASIIERHNVGLTNALINGDVDMIITPGRMKEYTMFDTMELYSARMVLCVSKNDPLSKKTTLSVMDMLDKPLGFLAMPVPVVEDSIKTCFSVFRKEPNVILRTSSVDMLFRLIREGRVCAVLPDDMLRDVEGVTGVPMDFADRVISHRAVWSKAVPLNSAAKSLIGFLERYKARSWANKQVNDIKYEQEEE